MVSFCDVREGVETGHDWFDVGDRCKHVSKGGRARLKQASIELSLVEVSLQMPKKLGISVV